MRNSSRGERMSRTTRLTMITAGLIWIGGIGHGSAWAGSLCTLPSQEEADIQAAAVSIQDEPTQQQEIDENGHYKPRRKARSPSTGTAQEPVKAQSAEGQTPPPDTDETDTAVGEAGRKSLSASIWRSSSCARPRAIGSRFESTGSKLIHGRPS